MGYILGTFNTLTSTQFEYADLPGNLQIDFEWGKNPWENLLSSYNKLLW